MSGLGEVASLTLLVGGARSGKSRIAERLITTSPGEVALIATAEAGTGRWQSESCDIVRPAPEVGGSSEEPLDLSGAMVELPASTRW